MRHFVFLSGFQVKKILGQKIEPYSSMDIYPWDLFLHNGTVGDLSILSFSSIVHDGTVATLRASQMPYYFFNSIEHKNIYAKL